MKRARRHKPLFYLDLADYFHALQEDRPRAQMVSANASTLLRHPELASEVRQELLQATTMDLAKSEKTGTRLTFKALGEKVRPDHRLQ